jgi:2-dehydropantoate 2-reductase
VEINSKFKIAIVGIGGVGGYFGGKLAAHYADSEEVEIIFVARGENAQAIRKDGLKVITTQTEFIAKPGLVTTEPGEIGEVDVFLICTKAYDLEDSINNYQPCISDQTAILSLLNGVDNSERILKIVPFAEVWQGCAYIASRLISPGMVKVESDIKLLQFGGLNGSSEKREWFEKLLRSAEIEVQLSADIDQKIWEKFIFISSLATLTSFLDTNVGGIKSSADHLELLFGLIKEVTQLARTKKIMVDENIEQITFERIRGMSDEITSSMHSDFKRKGNTELESLTGFVVRESELNNLATPIYKKLYQDLKERS